MKFKIFPLLILVISILYVMTASAQSDLFLGTKLGLSEEEIKELKSGKKIVKYKEIPNAPWPEITYFSIVNATPLESLSLFSAYDIQKDYIPNLIKSTPIKEISSIDIHTQYELKMPFPLTNAHYIHGAKIFKHKDYYETSWYLVESTSTKKLDGNALFYPYENKTIFIYRSFIEPKSALGSLVKKMMFKDVEKTISAIINFIETTKEKNPQLLTKYTEFSLRAFKGESVYFPSLMPE